MGQLEGDLDQWEEELECSKVRCDYNRNPPPPLGKQEQVG